MKKILVTGANGQLGKALSILAKQYPQFQIMSTDRAELDITQQYRINGLFRRESFDYCINAAAFTAVDKAETDADTAHLVNVIGSKNLAEACHLLQIPLIQISTDYVYNGKECKPIKEDQSTAPLGVYASTKLAGEVAAKLANPQTMVIRTSWVYAPFGHNFLRTMLKYGIERESLNVVYDQIGTPTYVFDLANAILTIINKVEQKIVDKSTMFDTYHFSNEGVASWYDFAKLIFSTKNISCKLNPILSEDFPTPAQRPSFSLLDKSKIKNTFGIEIPNWMDSVKACLKEFS